MLSACEEGNLDEVDRFIEEVGDVNIRVQLGDTFTTPLIHSAKGRQYSVVEHLITSVKGGAESIDECDSDGRTVLHYACMHGKLSIVKMLLYKFPILSIDFLEKLVNDLNGPIWAIDITDVAQHVFSQLHRCGPFIECEDNERNKPIMLAAKKRNYDIACFLICHGADVKCLSYDHGQKVLSWAIGNCHWIAIKVLISGGFLGVKQFHAISSYGCLSKLKELPDSVVGPLASKILTFAITNNIYKVFLKNFIANNFAIDGLLDTNHCPNVGCTKR